MNEPHTAQTGGLAGEWRLQQAGGTPCRLILSDETSEARAGGAAPAPMRGARIEGDCSLERPVGGWREAPGGGLELVDRYGQTITTLERNRDGFGQTGGLTVVRP